MLLCCLTYFLTSCFTLTLLDVMIIPNKNSIGDTDSLLNKLRFDWLTVSFAQTLQLKIIHASLDIKICLVELNHLDNSVKLNKLVMAARGITCQDVFCFLVRKAYQLLLISLWQCVSIQLITFKLLDFQS